MYRSPSTPVRPRTTSLSPQRGRIFLVAVRDSAGLATVLEAASPGDEAKLIADLCALIRERDPDIIENHNPSIMRVFQIGPACDHLGVFLYLVDRLTDLRLQHKTAARTAPPDSAAAHQHHAIQAAMKILVNSAYGYMGAGSMALFADRHAADEVTRRGREILGQVTDALRERGMALLEADTDGVYFAAPLRQTEQQERGVVAAVGARLPEGIRLEYEGRYQAMLVHE